MEVILAIGTYLIPTMIAKVREHHQIGAIFVVNLFLGWTVIGWIVALAMAAGHVKHDDGTSPRNDEAPHRARR